MTGIVTRSALGLRLWRKGIMNADGLRSVVKADEHQLEALRYLPMFWDHASKEAERAHREWLSVLPKFQISQYITTADHLSGTFPHLWECWWAFKSVVGFHWTAYEYCQLNSCITAVLNGDRPFSEAMARQSNRIPDPKGFRGCVNVQEALNELNQEFKHLVYGDAPKGMTYNSPDYHSFIWDFFHWADENTKGMWHLDEFAGTFSFYFSDEEDAMLFRLMWNNQEQLFYKPITQYRNLYKP